MNRVTKGLIWLALWLMAGFAFAEFTAFALSIWLKGRAPAAQVDANPVAAKRVP